jgi:hypothetical protein
MISVLIGLGILSAAMIPLETIWPGSRRSAGSVGIFYSATAMCRIHSRLSSASPIQSPPISLDSSYGVQT